ncbi:hypothetical protein [Corynebacterium deserti]|nr:hypothetical protein [Corynebacterium deserti]
MTTHPLDYLIDTFGISRTEARRRIELAQTLFPSTRQQERQRGRRGEPW